MTPNRGMGTMLVTDYVRIWNDIVEALFVKLLRPLVVNLIQSVAHCRNVHLILAVLKSFTTDLLSQILCLHLI